MKAFAQRFFPYLYVSNVSPRHPLFKLESRRVRRLLDGRELFWMSFRVARIVFLILFVLWLLVVIGDRGYPRYYYYPAASTMITLVFAVSILMDGLLDFASIVASINGLSGEVITGRWDLLRMTPYTAEDLSVVKHIVARFRVWRMTSVVFAIRLTWLALVFFTWIITDGLRHLWFELNQLPVYFVLVLFVLIYLAEPFWRADVMTAVGLAISSRLRNGLSLTLGGIGAVLAFWILQPLIIGFIFWCSWSTLLPRGFYISDPTINNFVTFLIFVYVIVVFYSFYVITRRIALGSLLRSIARSD